VTGAINAAQNVIKCVHRCGYQVDEVILQQLASAEAVLTDDERDLGVCLVDIGGGTTDIAVFTQGSISYSAVIPIGGDQVTNDIAVALRTPTQHAEQIKIQYACCLSQLVNADELVEVPSITGRAPQRLARQNLAEVVQNRYEELFELVQDQLQRSGFESLIGAGVVLTGGSSRMEGVVELAEEVFHMPVRLGSPSQVNGLAGLVDNPIYSTAVGLLLFGYRYPSFKALLEAHSDQQGLFERLMRWVKGNF
jgi:cell division protein FtsA